MISVPSTSQQEAIEYVFKTRNSHVSSIIEMLENELKALTSVVIAPNVSSEQRTHLAGQAMVYDELIRRLKF